MSHAAHMSADAPPPSSLSDALQSLGPPDGVQALGGRCFLPFVEAATGRRFGLSWTETEPPLWGSVEGEEVVSCDPLRGKGSYLELMERPRHEVEDELDAAAQRYGLDVGDVLRSLPSVPWVTAVLGSRHNHLCRMALLWLLPSELREARPAIVAVAEDETLRIGLRQLARRLIVAEDA